MMTTSPTTVDCSTAEELLAELYPANKRWAPRPTQWMFRGQADADWNLVPSSMRHDAWKALPWIPRSVVLGSGQVDGTDGTGTRASPALAWIAEHKALTAFERAADNAALSLPEDTQEARNSHTLHRVYEIRKGFWWPPSKKLSVLALAQHHGVPTRLLDWSWKGRVASYFAAVRIAKQRRGIGSPIVFKSDRFAVWALHAGFVRTCCEKRVNDSEPELSVVTAPYASNANLSAQAGVFTVDRDLAAARTFEEAIRVKIEAGTADNWCPKEPLFRFTVPHSEAGRLLRLLAWESVHAGTLYPGYGGVALSLKEKQLWDYDTVEG